MTEQQFLKGLAVDAFFRKYGVAIDPEACSIKSIPTQAHRDRSYEVETARTDDYVRIRLHINFRERDGVESVSLEVDETTSTENLGDEVFVVYMSVDRSRKDSGQYQFNPIDDGVMYKAVLLTEPGVALADEDGLFVSLGN